MNDPSEPQDLQTVLDAAARAQAQAAEQLAVARDQAAGVGTLAGPGLLAALGDSVAAIAGATSTRGVLGELNRAMERLIPGSGGIILLRSAEGDAPSLAAFWHTDAHWVEGSGRPPAMPEQLESLSRGDARPDLCLSLAGSGLSLGECRLWLPGQEDASQSALARMLVDVTALALGGVHLQSVSRHRSVRDSVTGLFNRRYMEDTLRRELHRCRRNKKPLGILQIDMDGMTAFNSRHGRTAGDRLLQSVAGLLQAAFRGSDAACRIDDDTFIVLLPEADLNDTRLRGEELRELINAVELPLSDGRIAGIPASIGVAGYPELAISPDELLLGADSAVQLSREAGGNAVTIAQRAG